MAVWVYFDASALVKRYSAEDGTDLVNELFRQLPLSQMTCIKNQFRFAPFLRVLTNEVSILCENLFQQRTIMMKADKWMT